MHKTNTRKPTFIAVLIGVLMILSSAWWFVQNKTNVVKLQNGQVVSLVGKVDCLKPRDETKVRSLVCAIGLTTDDNISYALNSDDPYLLGSIPSEQRIKVSGKFTQVSSGYKSKGSIKVISLQKL